MTSFPKLQSELKPVFFLAVEAERIVGCPGSHFLDNMLIYGGYLISLVRRTRFTSINIV
jgi:hypothetical protein